MAAQDGIYNPNDSNDRLLLGLKGTMSEFELVTLRDWLDHGWVQRRQTPARGRWLAWADADELQRLRQLQAHCRRGKATYPPALKAPKERAEK